MTTPAATPRRRALEPTRAVAYLRWSTDRQDLTPEAQRAALNGWAEREGVSIVAWYDDPAVSGGDAIEDCPGLQEAINTGLRDNGAGVFLVAKRDRLARDTMKAGMLQHLVERQGARVVSAAGEGNGSDPTDVLLRGIIDLFAQHERLMIAARTRAALQVKRARGEALGSVPYGYSRTEGTRDPVTRRYTAPPRLVPNPAEQATIAVIRDLRMQGLTYRGIAAELERRGIAPRAGGRWHATTIARVLAHTQACDDAATALR